VGDLAADARFMNKHFGSDTACNLIYTGYLIY